MSELKKAQEKRALMKQIKEKKQKLKLDLLRLKHGIKTDEQIDQEIKERYEIAYSSYPLEQRQKFLDLVHAGKTIGDAYKEAGISFECAMEVFKRSIKESSYLSRKVEE